MRFDLDPLLAALRDAEGTAVIPESVAVLRSSDGALDEPFIERALPSTAVPRCATTAPRRSARATLARDRQLQRQPRHADCAHPTPVG